MPTYDPTKHDNAPHRDSNAAAKPFDPRAFRSEQHRVSRATIVAALVTVIAFVAARWLPVAATDELSTGDRLAYALRCDLFICLWLLAAIARVASARFASPSDIAGAGLSSPTPLLRQAQAVLQNTLEQVVLALPVHLALATLLPRPWLGLIPILVLLFGVGRAAFWRGYGDGAAARALGFGLTFYPTIAAYMLSIGLIVQLVVR